jgi:8-oxo-dGTP pyrophosphatase MutT (NUDIX family)
MADYSQIPDCFYRISIKALVLNDEWKFLLCREDDGRWEFPGGGYEYGEITPQECIIREIAEEMWLEVTSIEEYPSYFVTAKHAKRWYHFANVFYKTKLKNLDITRSDECEEVSFFTAEEAMKLELFPNVQEFCKQYNI